MFYFCFQLHHLTGLTAFNLEALFNLNDFRIDELLVQAQVIQVSFFHRLVELHLFEYVIEVMEETADTFKRAILLSQFEVL